MASHLVPKELKGEERIIEFPYFGLYLSKKGIVYCGTATIIASIILKLTNIYISMFFFVALNAIAYPMSIRKISAKKFDCGNMPYDAFFVRKFRYKKNKNIYLRTKKFKGCN